MRHAHILLVDDNAELLEALGIRLRAHGYRISFALGGEEALRSIRAEPPQLVIMDIGMPRCDGHSVARQLKADPATRRLPIIFLTARTQSTDLQLARRAGVEMFIGKPFEPEELLEAVARLLSEQVCPV